MATHFGWIRRLAFGLFVASALVFSTGSLATNVQFVGSVAYSYVGNTAVLTANRVENFTSGGTSGTSPGPNSHFFSILDRECLALRSMQVLPTPANVQQWNYEAQTFSATPPITSFDGTPIACDPGLMPVYRYYNNAYNGRVKNVWDSNHRYGSDKAALDTFAQSYGWSPEGIAFCALP